MAFQIKDDLFDLMGSESDTGKNSGGDIKKNMKTLHLIFALSNMGRSEKRKLNKLLSIKKKNNSVLTEIKNIVDEAGGFEYARLKLEEYSNKAIDSISFYPESDYKKSLIDIVSFNSNRVK